LASSQVGEAVGEAAAPAQAMVSAEAAVRPEVVVAVMPMLRQHTRKYHG